MDKETIEAINDANKNKCYVNGITYEQVKGLREELKKHHIDSSIEPGGLLIYFSILKCNPYEQMALQDFLDICAKFDAVPRPGYPRHMTDVLLRNNKEKEE